MRNYSHTHRDVRGEKKLAHNNAIADFRCSPRKPVAQVPNTEDGGSINNEEPIMARASISLVSVQKPTANTPVLQRRNKLASSIDQQITTIGLFREGKRISREQFWVDANGGIFFQLRYGKQPLELEKGKSTLKAIGTGTAAWDDLVEQLEQIKTLAVAGGLDD